MSNLQTYSYSKLDFQKVSQHTGGRATHICVSKLTIIGWDNGLSPGRRQAIIWTSAGILLTGPLGTNFSEILIELKTFSLKKMRLKVSSAKWRPCCLGLNVLIHCTKRHKDNLLLSLVLPHIIFTSRECKHDIKESEGNMFNPIFKENVHGRKHPGTCAFAEPELLSYRKPTPIVPDVKDGHKNHNYHRFRRLFIDLLLMGWRGCTSAMVVIKTPYSHVVVQNHYVINWYITT